MANGKNTGRRGLILLISTLVVFLSVGVSFPHPAVLQITPVQTQKPAAAPTSIDASVVETGNPDPVQNTEPASAGNEFIDNNEKFLLISMREDNHFQLFSFNPSTSRLTQLTRLDWDLISPAFSPDGNSLAFSSNMDGYWDLYTLDLINNSLTKITDTPQYDASPSWSPDGKWLAYETYDVNNLNIDIISTVPGDETLIELTDDPAADHSPEWSPDGRYILFVSSRTGDDEIWIADLHTTQDRYMNMSNRPSTPDQNPVWSPDGYNLLWTSVDNGASIILRQEAMSGKTEMVVTGSQPEYQPDGTILSIVNQGPRETMLDTFALDTGKVSSVPVVLPGMTEGMVWIPGKVTDAVIAGIQKMGNKNATKESNQNAAGDQTAPAGSLVLLEGINAPQPFLVMEVVSDFNKLHDQVEKEIGWNFMDNLENAFIPITQPPSPEMDNSWLYTGRAIAVNTSPLYGDWMCVVREEFDGQTYWRIYLKTRYQDGSQGMPLKSQIWDFTTRQSGDTTAYENGGSLANPPEGYWIDFTALASQNGWNRLPALRSWRSYMDGTLFNQFVHDDNLTWYAAMLELYPPETLSTSTSEP